MPEIALPAFHETKPVRLVIEFSQELATDVERYKAFYKQAYGAEVPETDLVREMARRFMESDRDFQAAKNGFKMRTRPSRRASSAHSQEAIA